jgi:phosphonopyruvate decarboxylase
VIDSRDIRYVGAANEGEAVAIAAGAKLGGVESVVMFQNSGLGNAVNPLTSLNFPFRLPVLVVTTWRGEPGGEHDEPQHELMGAITPGLLELMRIPWELFPGSASELTEALSRARAHMASQRLPYAFILPKGNIEAAATGRNRTPERAISGRIQGEFGPVRLSAEEALSAVVAGTSGSDVVIATTGFTGRALYAVGDEPNQLYVVGSMGCATSLGLGLALVQNGRRVIVLDGDGAMLMHLGATAIIGHEAPANFVHVLLDNGVHDSTGAQATVAPAVDLAATALACGYREVARVEDGRALRQHVAGARSGPTFLHVRTQPRENRKLPRPESTPIEIADRFANWMASHP